MTKFTKHCEFEDTYDDPNHPIPSLTHMESSAFFEDGRAICGIIISSPLQADEYSQKRLLDKLEGYLRHINSDQFRNDGGTPDSSKTTIEIRIHPDSDPIIFELLDRCRDWIESNHASLAVIKYEK